MLLMILFMGVQFNDPDGSLWTIIYATPAVWTAIAAFKRPWLSRKIPHILLLLTIAIAIAGLVYFWPDTPGWWRQDVWWETETAREGMGMMIITAVLVVVWFSRQRSKSVLHPA